jgi:hypothetical protein
MSFNQPLHITVSAEFVIPFSSLHAMPQRHALYYMYGKYVPDHNTPMKKPPILLDRQRTPEERKPILSL